MTKNFQRRIFPLALLLFVVSIFSLLSNEPSRILPQKSNDKLKKLIAQIHGTSCTYVYDCNIPKSPLEIHSYRNHKYVCLEQAAACLQKMGDNADTVIPAIIEAIHANVDEFDTGDGTYYIHANLIKALGQIGDESILAFVVELFEKSKPTARKKILEVLGSFGESAVIAEKQIRETLKSSDTELTNLALVALGGLKNPAHIPLIVPFLDQSETTLAALEALSRIGPAAAQTFEAIVATLDRKGDDDIRRKVIFSLRALATGLSEGDLARLSKIPGEDIQVLIVQIIGLKRTLSPFTIGKLEDSLSGSRVEKAAALQAIRELGAGAATLAPKVAALLYDSGESVSEDAAKALVAIGPKHTLLVMLEIAQGDNEIARYSALEFLRRYGRLLTPYVSTLVQRLHADDNENVLILRAIGAANHVDPQTESMIRSYLKASNPQVRVAAQYALVGVVSAETALPTLEQMLDDLDTSVRCSSASLIGAYGPAASSSVARLIEVLNREQKPYATIALLKALREIDTEAANQERIRWAKVGMDRAVAMTSAINEDGSPDAERRYEGARRLGIYAFDPERSGPILAKLLTEKDPDVRYAAAEALGNFGSSAANWNSNLRAALNDETSFVKTIAAISLLKINGSPDAAALSIVGDAAGEFLNTDQERYLRFLERHFPQEALKIVSKFPSVQELIKVNFDTPNGDAKSDGSVILLDAARKGSKISTIYTEYTSTNAVAPDVHISGKLWIKFPDKLREEKVTRRLRSSKVETEIEIITDGQRFRNAGDHSSKWQEDKVDWYLWTNTCPIVRLNGSYIDPLSALIRGTKVITDFRLVGEELINGKLCYHFRRDHDGIADIWFDKTDGVVCQMQFSPNGPNKVYSAFKLNQEIDEALFSP